MRDPALVAPHRAEVPPGRVPDQDHQHVHPPGGVRAGEVALDVVIEHLQLFNVSPR